MSKERDVWAEYAQALVGRNTARHQLEANPDDLYLRAAYRAAAKRFHTAAQKVRTP